MIYHRVTCENMAENICTQIRVNQVTFVSYRTRQLYICKFTENVLRVMTFLTTAETFEFKRMHAW